MKYTKLLTELNKTKRLSIIRAIMIQSLFAQLERKDLFLNHKCQYSKVMAFCWQFLYWNAYYGNIKCHKQYSLHLILYEGFKQKNSIWIWGQAQQFAAHKESVHTERRLRSPDGVLSLNTEEEAGSEILDVLNTVAVSLLDLLKQIAWKLTYFYTISNMDKREPRHRYRDVSFSCWPCTALAGCI